MTPDFVLERQRNAIQFATLLVKSILTISSGAFVSLLAFIATTKLFNDCFAICLIGFLISVLFAFLSVYSGYWSELNAYNKHLEKENKTAHDQHSINEQRQFRAGHCFAVASCFVLFSSAAYTIFVIYWSMSQ